MFYHGATDAADAAENVQPRLHSVLLPERAHAVGRRIGDLDLDGLVEITGVRRRGARAMAAAPETVLESGDVLVLLGRPEQLSIAESRMLKGERRLRA